MPASPSEPPASIVLCTLNARYIHASLGLRYLLANMARHGSEALRQATQLREYTIHRPAREIAADLLATLGARATSGPRILGFGVYIWNTRQTLEVLRLLRAADPGIVLVLGGPEVSHETSEQAITALADHVITGWGDVSFPRLCQALAHGPRSLMKLIPGEQPALQDIALPYDDYTEADLAQRVLYVEASRGCPFKCEFCLSSLDKTAWAFELDDVLAALERLHRRGARQFKFVDRTFNLKIEASARILQFFLDRMSADLQLHFEVVPDHLPQRLKTLIALFPPGVLQLEIGIQSFNEQVQQRIARRQDNAATEANLRWLLAHSQAHLHTDLIFGLPGETLESFAAGFDRLYVLGPHEIQLGLLKRLRGTPLARRGAEQGMVYDPEPPYTVRQTGAVDAATVQRFARMARYWDRVANSGRFAHTLPLLLTPPVASSSSPLSSHPPSPFARFLAFSDWVWSRTAHTHRFSPEDWVDLLFDHLHLHEGLPAQAVHDALLADYLASGARGSPKALRGQLPRRDAPVPRRDAGLHQRQQRHAPVAARGQGSKIAP